MIASRVLARCLLGIVSAAIACSVAAKPRAARIHRLRYDFGWERISPFW